MANIIKFGGGSASGDATASDLLLNKTATVDAGEITGTMPNNGAVNITPSASNQAISAGYHNGSGLVYGDADLVAENIKSGVNIFGVVGTVESTPRTYLYKDGVMNTVIGGGLTTNITTNGSVTYNSDHIALVASYVNGVTFGRASIATVNAVSVAPYTSLNMEYEVTQESAYSNIHPIQIGLINSRNWEDFYLLTSQNKDFVEVSSNKVTLTQNLFKWNVSKYLTMFVYPGNTGGTTTIGIKIYKIWLE